MKYTWLESLCYKPFFITIGYINERSLYHYNVFLPNMKRRIHDDLSQQPQPYRILKQMLLAPGSLSGYTFYRVKTTLTEDGMTPGESFNN